MAMAFGMDLGGGTNEFDDFDAAGVDVGGQGQPIEIEGAYHLELADAKWEDAPNKKGRKELLVRFVALHSTPGLSPAGSVCWHRAELPNDADANTTTKSGAQLWPLLLSSFCQFVAGCGVFQIRKGPDGKDQFIDPATGSTKLQMSTVAQRLMDAGNGHRRQVIGRLKEEVWDKSDGSKGRALRFPFGRGLSAIGDPGNAHIPIDESAARAAGYQKAAPKIEPGVAAKFATHPATHPATPSAPAASAASAGQSPPTSSPDEYGDLF